MTISLLCIQYIIPENIFFSFSSTLIVVIDAPGSHFAGSPTQRNYQIVVPNFWPGGWSYMHIMLL